MYALIDCNSFYCSVERSFRADLTGKPIVVLSNNDGCVISRSDEAKAVGIEMGAPIHLIQDVVEKNKVVVFSSNYTLYGDISDRVMKTVGEMVPALEVYSIDECFADLSDLMHCNLLELAVAIRQRLWKEITIPVCVGIAATKTLAKMANRYAKKYHKPIGVFWAANEKLTKEMLEQTAVGDIWGVGRQYAKMLNKRGIKTALELSQVPDDFMRKNMSVVGLRLLKELQGIPCKGWNVITPKKAVGTAKSFGSLLTNIEDIELAAANYAAECAKKLRAQKSCCSCVQVFLATNQFRTQDQQYFHSIDIRLLSPTNNTGILIEQVKKGVRMIFKAGYNYHKVGVMTMGLVPENVQQNNFFDAPASVRNTTVMNIMDRINLQMGNNTLKIASQGFDKIYTMRQEHLSPRYTTRFDEILKIYE